MKTAIVALAIGACLASSAQAGNLVTNGRFETGDLDGWSVTPATDGSDYYVQSYDAHTGEYAMAFGALAGLDDAIWQDVATTAGKGYTLSFWVDASQGVTGHFAAQVDGTTIVDTGAGGNGYQEYTYYFTATSSTTRILFEANTGPAYYFLDDVGVAAGTTPVPEPVPATLLVLGLGGMLGMRRARRGAD